MSNKWCKLTKGQWVPDIVHSNSALLNSSAAQAAILTHCRLFDNSMKNTLMIKTTSSIIQKPQHITF